MTYEVISPGCGRDALTAANESPAPVLHPAHDNQTNPDPRSRWNPKNERGAVQTGLRSGWSLPWFAEGRNKF